MRVDINLKTKVVISNFGGGINRFMQEYNQ